MPLIWFLIFYST